MYEKSGIRTQVLSVSLTDVRYRGTECMSLHTGRPFMKQQKLHFIYEPFQLPVIRIMTVFACMRALSLISSSWENIRDNCVQISAMRVNLVLCSSHLDYPVYGVYPHTVPCMLGQTVHAKKLKRLQGLIAGRKIICRYNRPSLDFGQVSSGTTYCH